MLRLAEAPAGRDSSETEWRLRLPERGFSGEASMRAVVFHDIGDVRLDDVNEPKIEDPSDAIIRITASAICGTDLHMIRGTMPGMVPGTILGHEAVGVVEEIGKHVRNLRVGDRVVATSTIACGACSYCRAGYFSQCDLTNGAFFGGPKD